MVSHEMSQMRSYCTAGAVLAHGQLLYFDDIADAIDAHLDIVARNQQ